MLIHLFHSFSQCLLIIKSSYKNLFRPSTRIIRNMNIPEVRLKFLETSLLNIQCLTWSKFNEPAIIMSTCLPYTRRGSASVARRIFSKLCTLNYIILVSGGLCTDRNVGDKYNKRCIHC